MSRCDRGTYTTLSFVETPAALQTVAGQVVVQKLLQGSCALCSKTVDCKPCDWEEDIEID